MTTTETALQARRVRSNAVLDAWQVTEDSINELARLLGGTVTHDWTSAPYHRTTLAVGAVVAELGDWILRDEDGRIIAVWDATFHTRYEPEWDFVDVKVNLDGAPFADLVARGAREVVPHRQAIEIGAEWARKITEKFEKES